MGAMMPGKRPKLLECWFYPQKGRSHIVALAVVAIGGGTID